jgi:hypothetical protein
MSNPAFDTDSASLLSRIASLEEKISLLECSPAPAQVQPKTVNEPAVTEETPAVGDETGKAPVAVEAAPVAAQEEAPAMAAPVVIEEVSEPAEPFDAFLVNLTKEEKEQFGALTLKLQKLPDMPRFEAGADNKVFFRRIFVNLGSVRGIIPDNLMEKIYQYTIQL